jgi:putative aminopeptidase FrvX
MKLENQLVELLNIHGISGNEAPVRDYLLPILREITDVVYVDEFGNLLASKKCGTGEGATVLLSAHMDTVRGVKKDKAIIERDGIYTAILSDGKNGVLGADDRAGIAIILDVLRGIPESFNGTVKVAFSREEEIGCIGAYHIDKFFYQDTDLAIVVDRRGNRDIVVGSHNAFCCDNVGLFMEECSTKIKKDYECVEGGTSDACVFSENGINSVNLSAGYQNEHTTKEFVSIHNMYDTVSLIKQVFVLINEKCHMFESVPFYNMWVKKYDYKAKSNDIWIGEEDIYSYIQDGEISIMQDGNEIIITEKSFEEIYYNFFKSVDKREAI